MESLTIKSADGVSSISFLDREPSDPSSAIDYFTVRVSDAGLDATARVYAYGCAGLPKLFGYVAQNWRTFSDSRVWSTIEGELKLEITHDGLGHFRTLAVLRNGSYERDWMVRSSIMLETSQLDRVAADIAEFIGQTG